MSGHKLSPHLENHLIVHAFPSQKNNFGFVLSFVFVFFFFLFKIIPTVPMKDRRAYRYRLERKAELKGEMVSWALGESCKSINSPFGAVSYRGGRVGRCSFNTSFLIQVNTKQFQCYRFCDSTERYVGVLAGMNGN